MDAGTRVRLTRDVERYPHFVVPSGSTGTVVRCDNELVSVKLDDAIDGAAEWDNHVHWYPNMFEDANFMEVFQEEVEPIND